MEQNETTKRSPLRRFFAVLFFSLLGVSIFLVAYTLTVLAAKIIVALLSALMYFLAFLVGLLVVVFFAIYIARNEEAIFRNF